MNSIQQQNAAYGFSLKEPQEGTMKKQILKSALIAVAGVSLMTGSALALPWDGLDSTYVVSQSMDYFSITDFTNNNSFLEIKVENAGYESDFGFYYVDSLGAIQTFKIFDKNSEQDAEATVTFMLDNGTYKLKLNNGSYETFSSVWGIYYGVYTDGASDTTLDYTFYTDASLNTAEAGTDHITTAYSSQYALLRVYLDDQLGSGSDNDWDDMTVVVHDVAPVPEPTAMLIFGAGALGLAGVLRRKNS